MLSTRALADPTRQRIIEMLAAGELSSGEIADRFAISAPAISQHLQVLKRARLVRARVEAQRRIYALDPVGFAELDVWLRRIRRYWQGRLDALEGEPRAAPAERAPRRRGKRRMRR